MLSTTYLLREQTFQRIMRVIVVSGIVGYVLVTWILMDSGKNIMTFPKDEKENWIIDRNITMTYNIHDLLKT